MKSHFRSPPCRDDAEFNEGGVIAREGTKNMNTETSNKKTLLDIPFFFFFCNVKKNVVHRQEVNESFISDITF